MLGETARRVGSAPSLAELHAALGFSPVCLAVERWLLEWEIDQGASSVTLTGDLDYPGWYTPDNVSIVLMPSPEPGASYAYVGGFEWELAREISLLWPDTAGGLNGVDTRDHARDLVGRSDWFLHYKP